MKPNEWLNNYKTEKKLTAVAEHFQCFKLTVLAQEGIAHYLLSLLEKLFS